MVRCERDIDRVAAAPVGEIVGSSPLTLASSQKCTRELRRGEIKRCMQRGPLVGYFIGCPACGFVASYLDEAVGYEEDPPAPGTRWPRLLIGIRVPPACFMCKARLGIEGGALVARRA